MTLTQSKERVYDDLISPLMTQIIAICKEHSISMLATYDIPNEENATLCCTTCLADESGEPSPRISKVARAAKLAASSMTMITTTAPNGDKTITAFI